MSEGGSRKSAAELLEGELLDLCKSELLSEEGLRAIIDTPNHHYNLRRRNRHVDDVDDYSFFIEACDNEKITEEIIRYLLEYFPDAANATTESGWTPLHFACNNDYVTLNIIRLLIDAAPESARSADDDGWMPLHILCQKNVTLGIIYLIIDAAPESVRSADDDGRMPLHILCWNREVDETAAVQILKLFIEKNPETVRHVDSDGQLPIHLAREKPLEFYQVLIEAYPGSERMATTKGDLSGNLPLHWVCWKGALSAVKFLYQQYPNAIDHATIQGEHPIHAAIVGMKSRVNPADAVEIVQFLLDCNPDEKLKQIHGKPLLHFACAMEYNDANIDAGIQMINVIFSAHPASVRSVNNDGRMLLHVLCCNRKMDEASAVQILKFLLEKCPEAVRHADNHDCLPIHLAAMTKSPQFCHKLIEAYQGSERMPDARGALPLHLACAQGSLATVEYLYRQYPDTIYHSTTDHGFYPIFYAISSIIRSDNPRDIPAAAVEIVKFLLDCDPDVKLQTFRERSLLHYACRLEYNESSIEAAIQVINIIYNAHPEAIEDSRIVSNIHRYHQQVQAFINNELVYARQAEDHQLMATPDNNGQIPLHVALLNDVRLGSIKLLVKGNRHAMQSPDNSGALPLHVACQHHDSTDIIDFLVGLGPSTLEAVDNEGNTALHLACRSAKYETITLLLEKYDAVSVSEQDTHRKLPIDLLWESNAVEDRESIEYTGSVFQLLKAYPETVMSTNLGVVTQQVDLGACRRSSHNEKKRKRGTV